MRATVMYGAGDVRIETVPDARLIESTDALVVVTRAAICGSDLWPVRCGNSVCSYKGQNDAILRIRSRVVPRA